MKPTTKTSDPLKALLPEQSDEQRFASTHNFLEQLVSMGEEDYEITCEVNSVAERAGKLLCARLDFSQDDERSKFIIAFTEAFFTWVYQVNLKRSTRMARVSEKLLEQFFYQFASEFESAEMLQDEYLYFLLAQLYHVMEDAGAPVNASLKARQIHKCYRRAQKVAPSLLVEQ